MFDDLPHIVDNPAIRQLWPPTILTGNSLRPLSFLSFALNHAVSGYAVWSYHAFTLFLHVAAALTLFAFARRALRLPRLALTESDATATAFAIALLWAVHPLDTQAVDYVIQRAEVLAGLASLLALHFLVRAHEAEDAGTRRRRLVGVAVAFYGGLGCKEVVATLPVTLYLFDAVVLTGSFVEPVRRRGGLYAALLAPFVVVPLLWLAVAPWRFGTLTPSPSAPPALEYAWSQGAIIVGYLRRVVWPTELNLDHAWDPAQHGGEVVVGACLVGAAMLATIAAVRRRSPLGWLGAVFFLALAPSSSFQPLADRMVEHRMYLATIPCLAFVVLGVRWGLARLHSAHLRRAIAACALAATTVALGAATALRNRDYADAERMWTDVAAKAPHNARAHYNLGCVLLASDEDRALGQFLAAVALRPGYVAAHNNAAAVYFRRRRFADAERHLRASIQQGDAPFDSLRNCASVLMELGRFSEAAEILQRAEERLARGADGQSAAARLSNDLGVCRRQTGAGEEALARFRRAVELDPGLAAAQSNLGGALAAAGRVGEAIDAYLAAIAADRSSAKARVALVALCVGESNRGTALSHLEDTLRREPWNAEAARVREFVRRAQ